MKRFLAAAALALLAAPAVAADLPTKGPRAVIAAPPVAWCGAVIGCTGWHVDFAVLGAGTGLDVLNLGSLTANGTLIGLGGGYQYYDGHYWLGARVTGAYDMSNPGNVGISDRLFGSEMVELGGDLFGALGLAPPQQSGFLATLTTAVPTADVGACQRGKANGYCVGATLHYFLPGTPLELKLGYLNANYGTTAVSDQTSVKVDNMVTFGGAYHFKP